MHRFALGGYLLQKTKERMLLITSKRRIFINVKGKVVELVTLVLGRFSICLLYTSDAADEHRDV